MSKTILLACFAAMLVVLAVAQPQPIHVPLKQREKTASQQLEFMKVLHLQRQGVFKAVSRFASPVNLNLTNSLPQGSASYYGPGKFIAKTVLIIRLNLS